MAGDVVRDVVAAHGLANHEVPDAKVRGDALPEHLAAEHMALGDTAHDDGVPDDVVIGDVSEARALQAVDAHLRAHGLPRLRGVIHAAGVLEDGLIADLDPTSFARVAAPKLGGLRAIQAQWPDLELLVGFSSAGALFGSAGQATHTAASAALDAALTQAAAAGQPVVTIDWGAWRDRGAAAELGATAALGAGMGSIATSDGFAALDHVLQSGVSHAAVLPIDRIAMRDAGAEPPLLRDATEMTEIARHLTPAPEVPTAMSAEDRRAWLQERVGAECAAMLAIRGTIELRRPLQELGLDSLAALELRNRLGRLAGAVLPASLLFDYPTVAALVDHLGSTWFGLAPASVAPADATAGSTMTTAAMRSEASLEEASDSDLDAALSAFAALHGDDAA
jgi:acyl carrier protein